MSGGVYLREFCHDLGLSEGVLSGVGFSDGILSTWGLSEGVLSGGVYLREFCLVWFI